MKKIFVVLSFVFLFFVVGNTVSADVYVNGYYKSNGTYVQGHYRSSPDSNPYNNYSYPGNTNPYTGKTAPGNASTYLDNYYSSGSSYTPTYVPSTYTPTYTVPSASTYVPTYTSSYSSKSAYEEISNGYTSYGILFCDSDAYEDGDNCRKAPKNGSVSYSGLSFVCDSGFEKVGKKCERKTVPNAYWDGDGYSCNDNYAVDYTGNKCVPILQLCQVKYGPYSVGLPERKCGCAEGYAFGELVCEKQYSSQTPYNYTRDLQIGSSGEDVIYLQTVLETEGFLSLPSNVSKGYFGTMTQSALKRYQIKIGLPATGVFNGDTRLMFNS